MSVLKSEADRSRVQAAPLADQYRAIGPAAILAAVLAVKTKKMPQLKPKAA